MRVTSQTTLSNANGQGIVFWSNTKTQRLDKSLFWCVVQYLEIKNICNSKSPQCSFVSGKFVSVSSHLLREQWKRFSCWSLCYSNLPSCSWRDLDKLHGEFCRWGWCLEGLAGEVLYLGNSGFLHKRDINHPLETALTAVYWWWWGNTEGCISFVFLYWQNCVFCEVLFSNAYNEVFPS